MLGPRLISQRPVAICFRLCAFWVVVSLKQRQPHRCGQAYLGSLPMSCIVCQAFPLPRPISSAPRTRQGSQCVKPVTAGCADQPICEQVIPAFNPTVRFLTRKIIGRLRRFEPYHGFEICNYDPRRYNALLHTPRDQP